MAMGIALLPRTVWKFWKLVQLGFDALVKALLRELRTVQCERKSERTPLLDGLATCGNCWLRPSSSRKCLAFKSNLLCLVLLRARSLSCTWMIGYVSMVFFKRIVDFEHDMSMNYFLQFRVCWFLTRALISGLSHFRGLQLDAEHSCASRFRRIEELELF